MLSPLLFIVVLEALSEEIRSSFQEELMTDDLVLVSKTSEGLNGRLKAWKKSLESKGLRINFKTKIMKMLERMQSSIEKVVVKLPEKLPVYNSQAKKKKKKKN